ncbi:MAG: hypothetical protein LQ340_005892 [Diploschistes diacapsis]|nr:MAG: hypothetical protein LQ340_005892 [Diploschistes diacapsis]
MAGGTAVANPVDVRLPDSIFMLFSRTLDIFGRLDAVVYNAGAIWWASVEKTNLGRFKLMQEVNVEGCYAVVQKAVEVWRERGWKGRVVLVSPPIYSRFFRGKTAYAMGKVGMSVLTKGLAMDWQREGKKDMAITSIWPAAAIESAATQQSTAQNHETRKDLRKATIFGDAILEILQAPAQTVNGQLLLDEDFLRQHCGVTDFSKYSLVDRAIPRRIMPKEFPVLEVAEQEDEGTRVDSTVLRRSKL